jgi:hypothetical protein
MPTNAGFEKKSLFRAVPGLFSRRRLFNPATPFDNASIAQQALTSILDSLGGILWLPNQHNYVLTTDTAVALVGDPVGYVGSHRQNLPENYVKNSMMVGTGGTNGAPDYWSYTQTANGVTTSVSTGTDEYGTYVQFSVSGTAGGTISYQTIAFNGSDSSGNHAVAAYAQLWSSRFKVRGISGTQRAGSIGLHSIDASNTLLTAISTAGFTPSDSIQTVTTTGVIPDLTCAYLRSAITVTVAAGSGTWDNVFRIYAPQLERGKPTTFTPTYGTAITRGTNFAPAWQDTTANKPLLGVDADGKGILTFDGTNDFFRTGIQTPEAGYVAGAWKLASPVPTARGLFSSSGAVTVGARFGQVSTTGEFRQGRHDGTTNTNSTTSTAIGAGKVVLDGHFAIASSSVRINGGAEGISGVTRNAATTQYFRIGADGTGTDTQANYVNGTMLAQIWIPGARPGATAEAEIRRLLAEITAVSGVV